MTPEAPKLCTDTLMLAWSGGFSTKSDYARAAADQVAELASRGWITTCISPHVYGRRWLITAAGLKTLMEVLHGSDV